MAPKSGPTGASAPPARSAPRSGSFLGDLVTAEVNRRLPDLVRSRTRAYIQEHVLPQYRARIAEIDRQAHEAALERGTAIADQLITEERQKLAADRAALALERTRLEAAQKSLRTERERLAEEARRLQTIANQIDQKVEEEVRRHLDSFRGQLTASVTALGETISRVVEEELATLDGSPPEMVLKRDAAPAASAAP